jgi:hypothetical protein
MDEFTNDPDLFPHLGALVTPNAANSLTHIFSWCCPWAADAGCYPSDRFNRDAYLRLLRRVNASRGRPEFVVVPDQVGSHESTAYLFERWLVKLARERLLDLPLAFVLQDGITGPEDVPWGDIEAVFVGGTTGFKEDEVGLLGVVEEAKARGKWVHLGRVNGRRRLWLALAMDCDSVDGSSLSRFPRTWIPKFVADVKGLEWEAAREWSLVRSMEEEAGRLGGAAA